MLCYGGRERKYGLLNGQSLASETLQVAQIQHSIPLHSIKRVTLAHSSVYNSFRLGWAELGNKIYIISKLNIQYQCLHYIN